MMMAPAMIVFALLVMGVLFLLIWSSTARESGKRKRDENVKPKRDENDRLILDEDGELIDFSDGSDKEADAQRNRNS